jgi:RNA polymerase sigma-70 factor (ECF subfamily)
LEAADDFRLIYEQCYADVYRYVARRVGTVDAADLTADVFTVAWRRMSVLPRDSPLPWLYTTARKVLANHLRSRAKEVNASHMATTDTSDSPDIGEQVSSRAAVHQAWQGLSERDREVLALIGWEGLSVKDAAVAAGCSAAAFSVRLMRARARLRRRLAGADPDSTTTIDVFNRESGVTP